MAQLPEQYTFVTFDSAICKTRMVFKCDLTRKIAFIEHQYIDNIAVKEYYRILRKAIDELTRQNYTKIQQIVTRKEWYSIFEAITRAEAEPGTNLTNSQTSLDSLDSLDSNITIPLWQIIEPVYILVGNYEQEDIEGGGASGVSGLDVGVDKPPMAYIKHYLIECSIEHALYGIAKSAGFMI